MLKTAIAYAMTSFVFWHMAYAENTKPLRLMTQYDWAGLTDKEKEVYVSGVLDGQAALLQEATQHAGPKEVQNMNAMVRCIESEGVKRIKDSTESLMVVHVEDRNKPIPWTISKVLAHVCQSYRDKPK